MNLAIRDFKNNLKSFIYWIIGISLLIGLLVLAYPVAIDKMDNLGDVINSMPKEIIAAFGLENYDWKQVLNYLAYEFQYIFLACAIFGATLGASIFSKEESNKTIELVYSKPVTRNHIFISKVLVSIIILLLFNLLLFAITYVSLKLAITDQFIDVHKVFNMYTAMFLIQLIFMSIGTFIAVIMKKPKPASGIASGLVIFTYLLGMFSNITEEMKNLVYISPLHYFLPDKIIRTGEFETKYLIITAGLTVVSLLIAWRVYNKKDFNI